MKKFIFLLVCILMIPGMLYANEKESVYSTKSERLKSTEKLYNIIFKDVTQFGIFNNGTDVTKELNMLPKGNYYFPKGIYGVDGGNNQGFIPKSDSMYFFEDGAILKVLPNDYKYYAGILIKDCSNMTLISPNVQGDRLKHDYSSGGTHEWGHGIIVYNGCGNVNIISPHIYDMTGDGIDIISPGSNIMITDLLIERSRRQGISLEDAGTVLINGGIIRDIYGVSPSSGIAIEPYKEGQHLKKITINDVVTENTNQGLLLAKLHLSAGFDVTLNDCTFDGISVCHIKKTDNGVININNPIINGANVGVFWTNAFVRVNLRNPIFMLDNITNEGTREGIFRFCELDKVNGDVIGGLTCTNAYIMNSQSHKYNNIFYFYNSEKSKITDINISVTKSNLKKVMWAKSPSTLKNITLYVADAI